jgi:oligoendopeptidase F
VAPEHTWDLSKLFATDQGWEHGLEEFRGRIDKMKAYQGSLGSSSDTFFEAISRLHELSLLAERLGYYAQLRYSEDAGDSSRQERFSRFMQAATQFETVTSYIAPEIQTISEETVRTYMAEERMADYRVYLERLLRYKPHILSENEERLLAMQEEANQTAQKTFAALTDVDIDYGSVDTPEGERPVSQSSIASLLQHQDRGVRERAYSSFFGKFDEHKNTLANLYTGSIHLDIYRARARKFDTAREAALFPDNVPTEVYDKLVHTVNDNFSALHEYYEMRRSLLGVEKLRMWDKSVPLVSEVEVKHSFEQAVDVVAEALAPLGEEYIDTLRRGLLGGWVDRYENKGKRSGAFSAGSFSGDPHILMNFKEDVLRDVFTLAHEGGHSMHSWYSSRNNPYPHYRYTIFEAEVASTFNEQLLFNHMMATTESDRVKTFLLNKRVDDIIATLFRQTMFAEFEHRAHSIVESGEPLSLQTLRSEYRALLEKYFGYSAELGELDDLEGLRIPHFYRAFYVYKYATGISASMTLAKRVLDGGESEREDYFAFLKSGGSRFPIDSLRLAGVDMANAEPIETALSLFAEHVRELKQRLKA